jgi:hypothetical protein
MRLAAVQWDHGESGTVNVYNLAIVGPNSYFCNTGLGIDPHYYYAPGKPRKKPESETTIKKRAVDAELSAIFKKKKP